MYTVPLSLGANPIAVNIYIYQFSIPHVMVILAMLAANDAVNYNATDTYFERPPKFENEDRHQRQDLYIAFLTPLLQENCGTEWESQTIPQPLHSTYSPTHYSLITVSIHPSLYATQLKRDRMYV
jgi:hypothetical protein